MAAGGDVLVVVLLDDDVRLRDVAIHENIFQIGYIVIAPWCHSEDPYVENAKKDEEAQAGRNQGKQRVECLRIIVRC